MKHLGDMTLAILIGVLCVYLLDFSVFQFIMIVLLEYCAFVLTHISSYFVTNIEENKNEHPK